MINPVTYCPECDTLTQHCEGQVIGYTKDTSPRVYHRHCLRDIVRAEDGERFYLPRQAPVPAGFEEVA